MFDETFDRFEELTPSGNNDVPVQELRQLLEELPDSSEETLIGVRILRQFEKASAFNLPTTNGLHLWLGHCVGGFQEYPNRETFFLFALRRNGDSLMGHATGIEDDDVDLPQLLSLSDLDRVSSSYVSKLSTMLSKGPTDKRSDWFSPPSHIDGISVAFKPNSSAKFFLRQDAEKLLFVQPSRAGGWYGELWKKTV